VKDYEKGQNKDELEIQKLQASLLKEQATLSDTRMIYAMAHHNIYVLGAAVKELNLANKKLRARKNTSSSRVKSRSTPLVTFLCNFVEQGFRRHPITVT
jgi:hypothetical protein